MQIRIELPKNNKNPYESGSATLPESRHQWNPQESDLKLKINRDSKKADMKQADQRFLFLK
jgi:hypothetical protein